MVYGAANSCILSNFHVRYIVAVIFFLNVLSLQEWAGVPDAELCIVNVSIYLPFQELLHQNFKQKLSVQ